MKQVLRVPRRPDACEVLLARAPDGALIALSPIRTHRRCDVECSAALHGPAQRPRTAYPCGTLARRAVVSSAPLNAALPGRLAMRRHLALIACTVVLSLLGCASHSGHHESGTFATAQTPSMTLKDQVVDAGCGACIFGMDNLPDCETAIRVNGVVFLATGAGVPDAEDHATGMCQALHKARVSGKTVGDKFVATSFVLLP